MYVPVAIAGYIIFGSTVDDNVIASLYKIANGPLLYIAQILIACHLLLEFVIVINPVLQEIEGSLKVPHSKYLWVDRLIFMDQV
jgi:vesicular inhibitory amino acid transporter